MNLLEALPTITSHNELDGFLRQWRALGRPLSTDDLRAIEARRKQLPKPLKRRTR